MVGVFMHLLGIDGIGNERQEAAFDAVTILGC